MGTRHLTMVFTGGQYAVAQYGQWDGYPEGQGITALEFLRRLDRDVFLANLAKARHPSDDELTAHYKALGADGSGFVNMEIANAFKAKWPTLDRDMGAGILQAIQDTPDGVDLTLQPEFAGDSLFCEFAYVVDFDKGTFEAYRGFNQEPLAEGERFASTAPAVPHESMKHEPYYQVKHVASWPLDALPTNEDFLAAWEVKEPEALPAA